MANRLARGFHAELILGLLCLLAGLLIVFVWAPLDSGSGIIEHVRGRTNIGDAMAPSVAGLLLGIAGLALCVETYGRKPSTGLNLANAWFLLVMAAIFAVSFSLMRWAGPMAILLIERLGSDLPNYHELRDTPPWKYIGYLAGGTFLISATISMIHKRFSWHSLLIGLCAAAVMALAYGVPFDDLLLPPNGDV